MSTQQIEYTGSGYDSNFVHDPSTGYTGIGTASPAALLDVSGTDPQIALTNTDTGNLAVIELNPENQMLFGWQNGSIVFRTNTTDQVDIDNSGNITLNNGGLTVAGVLSVGSSGAGMEAVGSDTVITVPSGGQLYLCG